MQALLRDAGAFPSWKCTGWNKIPACGRFCRILENRRHIAVPARSPLQKHMPTLPSLEVLPILLVSPRFRCYRNNGECKFHCPWLHMQSFLPYSYTCPFFVSFCLSNSSSSICRTVTLEVLKPWAPIGLPVETVSVEITRSWHQAYVAIGSNLGDRGEYIKKGIEALKQKIISKSSVLGPQWIFRSRCASCSTSCKNSSNSTGDSTVRCFCRGDRAGTAIWRRFSMHLRRKAGRVVFA